MKGGAISGRSTKVCSARKGILLKEKRRERTPRRSYRQFRSFGLLRCLGTGKGGLGSLDISPARAGLADDPPILRLEPPVISG